MDRLTIFTAAALAGCGPAKPAAPATSDVSARLDQVIADVVAKRDLPGMALAVVQGDRVIYSKGHGFADIAAKRPMTDSTPTVIGSTSKPLTALAVLRLVAENKLALDTPIVRYIPEIKFTDPRGSGITLRQLLTNRSGIVAGFSGAAYQRPAIQDSAAVGRLAREIATIPLLFAPGQGYKYSNRGWVLAGYIVERVGGMPVEDFMAKEVYGPLGMTHTTLEFWKVPDIAQGYWEGIAIRNHPGNASVSREYGPAGMMVSTVQDMAKLEIALMNGGKSVTGQQFLTPALLAEAFRPQADAESELGGPTKYGLGWEVDSMLGTLTIKKAGSVGTLVALWVMLPERHLGLVFTFNREDYQALPVLQSVLKVLAGGTADSFPSSGPPAAPPTPVAVNVAPGAFAKWIGSYDTRNGDAKVYQRGDSLFAELEGIDIVLVPSSDSSFVQWDDRVHHAGNDLSFHRGRGQVTIWSGKDSLGIKVSGKAK
ncbi:MAG: serine hydrolase domain-containing protein [Gemmatimonadota bacterium]